MRTLGIVLALTLLAAWPLDAEARGGTYRGPGGAVPPMLREPTDPTPPPPPPPVGPPAAVPVMGSPNVPTPPPITTPPPTPPPVHPDPSRSGSMMSFDNWRFWYHHDQEVLEARPPVGRALAEDRTVTQARILPALLWCLDANHDVSQHVRAAGYVALGKVARDPEHVALLRKAAGDERDLYARESAIVALGLLRRTTATDRLPADLLDAVRADLFALLRAKEVQARARAFAASALGLLGDQPTRSAVGAKALTQKLFALLGESHHHPDVPLSILLAVGLQPRDSSTPAQRETLKEILRTGEIAGRRAYLGRAHAAIALGRVGQADDAPALLAALQDPAARSRNGGRSAALALGTLAPRLEANARADVVAQMIALLDLEPKEKKPAAKAAEKADEPAIEPVRDPTQRGVMLLALARLAAVDLDAGEGLSQRIAIVEGFLRARLLEAAPGERTFAALALAELGRAMHGAEGALRQAYGRRTAVLLRQQLEQKSVPPIHRGAFAVALGLAGSGADSVPLLDLLQDAKQDPGLRGACARGLALLGTTDARVGAALEAALRERRSELLRIDCSAALGALGVSAAGGALLDELTKAKSWVAMGTAAAALGGIGARDQVEALVKLAQDDQQDAPTRAMAVVALGRIADPEAVPSMARITAHLNWRASTDFLNELFALL